MANSRSNVDYLFHSQSIEQIKLVRQKLESDILKTSDDLQQLVVDRYLPLLDANDLLQDVSKKCIAAIKVLENFDDYWRNEKKNRQVVSVNLHSIENENRLATVSSVISLLNSIRNSWVSLEKEDFINAAKLLLQIDVIFSALDESVTPPPLINYISDSINNVKKWFKISAVRVFNDPQSNENVVINALVGITLIADHKSLEETLELFLQSSSLKSDANADLTSSCCQLVNLVSFVSKITYQAFLSERSDATLPLLIKSNFPSYALKNVDREVVMLKSENWLSQQKTCLDGLLEPIFGRSIEFESIISALICIEMSYSAVRNDWNHYGPLVFSCKLDVWRDFLSPTFRPALNESIVRLIKQCPLALDQSFPPTNVDMASFVWPNALNDPSDSLETFELRINGISPGYVSASEKTFRFIKTLANQCEDLHPEVPLVGSEDSKEIKEKLVTSFIEHTRQSLEQMKLEVKRNELLTLQAINVTRNIATRCKPLKTFLDLSDDTSKWLEVKSLLFGASSEWIQDFISNKIEIESTKCLKQLNLESDWIDAQSALWEDVTIVDESDNENKRSATIKVPIFTSPFLLEFFYKICNYINRYFAHVMPETASQALFIKLSNELAALYSKVYASLSQIDISASSRHKQALQFSFDLIFLRLIISTCKDSQMRTTLSQISSVHRSFESLVDPFDLHLISKNMQTNASQAVKSHMQLLSLIVPESCLAFLKKAPTSTPAIAKKS